MEKTRLSSKGQLVLPGAIRSARNFRPGQEFSVEDVGEGILLRPLKPFASTRLDDVFRSAGYEGPARSLEDMEAAVAAEAARRAK